MAYSDEELREQRKKRKIEIALLESQELKQLKHDLKVLVKEERKNHDQYHSWSGEYNVCCEEWVHKVLDKVEKLINADSKS